VLTDPECTQQDQAQGTQAHQIAWTDLKRKQHSSSATSSIRLLCTEKFYTQMMNKQTHYIFKIM
jgi:hypothetical protein